MTGGAIAFYALAAFVLATAALAVTRRAPMDAVVWLVLSVLGTALVFALLGAPLLAALMVMVYAGGILVLFLFVIVMLKAEPVRRSPRRFPALRRALPVLAFAGLATGAGVLLFADPRGAWVLTHAPVSPSDFGEALFGRETAAVEVASTLLFAALVGSLYVGRGGEEPR